MNLKGIINAIATVGWALIKIVSETTPFLRALLPKMSNVWDDVDAMIRKGGIEADDFITKNADTFDGFIELGRDLVVVGNQLQKVAQMTLDAAAPPSSPGEPDLVTPGEAEKILREVAILKNGLIAIGVRADSAHPMLLSLVQAGPKSDASQSPTLNA